MRGFVLAVTIAMLGAAGEAAHQGSAPQGASKIPPAAAASQDNPDPEVIIQKFAAKEAEFREARNNYIWRQTLKMMELDFNGNPQGGEWNLIEDIFFTPEGKRTFKLIWAPPKTLKNIQTDAEDEQDLREIQPFVLTSTDVGLYEIKYAGRDKIDEIGTYNFEVKPKKLVAGKRYFQGTIWVDDRDFQIVKTFGKGVGIVKKGHAYPMFETYREQIDGKYWFPTYTRADDTLHFPDGQDQRIRMTVKYQDYKRYEGKSTITYGNPVDDTKPAPPPPAKKQ